MSFFVTIYITMIPGLDLKPKFQRSDEFDPTLVEKPFLQEWFNAELRGGTQHQKLSYLVTTPDVLRCAFNIAEVWPDIKLSKNTLENATQSLNLDRVSDLADYLGILAVLQNKYQRPVDKSLKDILLRKYSGYFRENSVEEPATNVGVLSVAMCALDDRPLTQSLVRETTKSYLDKHSIKTAVSAYISGKNPEMPYTDALYWMYALRIFDPDSWISLDVNDDVLDRLLVNFKVEEEGMSSMLFPEYPRMLSIYQVISAQSVKLVAGKGLEIVPRSGLSSDDSTESFVVPEVDLGGVI